MPDERDHADPVFVFDLDGTVLRVNSFPHWVLFLACGRVGGLGWPARIRLSLATGWALLRRKAGLLDHEALKHRLQRAWQAATRRGATAPAFQAELDGLVRPVFRPLLARVRSGGIDAVLATAAAADYAEPFGQRLGFRHVLSTPTGRPTPGPSNVGAYKRDSVAAFMAAQGWAGRPIILFTDHDEDLPLMRVARTTYWFGSARRAQLSRDGHPGIDLRENDDLSGLAG